MKKSYSKPQIMFEDFSLSTNIAGDCDNKVGSPSEDQCGVEYDGDMIFSTTISGCNVYPAEDLICYHNPSESSNLFNS